MIDCKMVFQIVDWLTNGQTDGHTLEVVKSLPRLKRKPHGILFMLEKGVGHIFKIPYASFFNEIFPYKYPYIWYFY